MKSQENKNCYASPAQRKILVELVQRDILKDHFFLTGGTALSVFYLHHRISNDLDFFTLNSIDLSEIDFSLKAIWKNSYSKIKVSPNFLSVLIQNVKVDFVIDPVSLNEERNRYFFNPNQFVQIDTIQNIFTNKFCTIASRIEPKDFTDFYFLNRHLEVKSLKEIYQGAQSKDAIFDDPPTVAYQIEQGIQFLQKNPDILPELLVEFQLDDFLNFYQNTVDWIYHKMGKN